MLMSAILFVIAAALLFAGATLIRSGVELWSQTPMDRYELERQNRESTRLTLRALEQREGE